MNWDTAQLALIVSVCALFVAVIGGVLNAIYTWYTRQLAVAAYRPVIEASLQMGGKLYNGDNIFSLRLANLHTSVAITAISFSIRLGVMRKGRLIGKQRWHLFHSGEMPTINAEKAWQVDAPFGEIKLVHDGMGGSVMDNEGIETFILQHFPNHIAKADTSGYRSHKVTVGDRTMTTFYGPAYRLLNPFRLPVSLAIAYKPAVSEAKLMKVSKSYILSPHTSDNNLIDHWVLTEQRR